MTERAREAVETVWEFAAYLLTAVLFVLIGLVIDIGALGAAIVPIAWGILAVVGSRAFLFYGIVGPANRLLRATEDRLPTGLVARDDRRGYARRRIGRAGALTSADRAAAGAVG